MNLTETISALSMVTKAGVPANKIVVGVTSYGPSFQMTTPGCYMEMCTYTGSSSGAYAGLWTQCGVLTPCPGQGAAMPPRPPSANPGPSPESSNSEDKTGHHCSETSSEAEFFCYIKVVTVAASVSPSSTPGTPPSEATAPVSGSMKLTCVGVSGGSSTTGTTSSPHRRL